VSEDPKIVLVANFLPDRQESMQRFANVLADGFARRGRRVEIWRPEPFFVNWVSHYRYGGFPKYLGYLDKFVRFPRAIRRRRNKENRTTVYHIVDHGNAVYAPHFDPETVVVTCHDLLQIRSALGEFPQNRLSRSGQSYQKWILKNLAQLRTAVCVSQKTRDDLRRLTPLSAEATPVIHNGLNYPYQPLPHHDATLILEKALAAHDLAWPRQSGQTTLQPPFLFGIGGAQWYKNRSGLFQIFGELAQRSGPRAVLLYVGPPLDPEQNELIARYKLSDRFVHAPSLTNEELRAAYSIAEGLIFPSWEEGFGWPIAEAQACGCPVFTSNRAPMTEVGGEAAVYFDPAAPAEAAVVIAKSLEHAAPLRAAGLRRAGRWNSEHMLDAYARLYSHLLSRREKPISAVA
jgi:glycosyltransferase involved in cell wall biosynthesis